MENQLDMTEPEKVLMQEIAKKAVEILTDEASTTKMKKKQEALELQIKIP